MWIRSFARVWTTVHGTLIDHRLGKGISQAGQVVQSNEQQSNEIFEVPYIQLPVYTDAEAMYFVDMVACGEVERLVR